MNELYEPLLERDLGAIAASARAFAEAHSDEELWTAVARFAVLAYAPSQHGKRAVMACRAAHGLGVDWTIECARYAAQSRPPWSEPPILDAPLVEEVPELRAAIAANDRPAAEQWLAANLDDAPALLREVAKGDALLMLDTAIALEQHLGDKGRFTLLRMVVHELFAESEHPDDPLELLIDRAIESKGAVEDVRAVFVRSAGVPPAGPAASSPPPYPLARDYAQTLIAHAIAPAIGYRRDEFLAAVEYNRMHGESYAEWV